MYPSEARSIVDILSAIVNREILGWMASGRPSCDLVAQM